MRDTAAIQLMDLGDPSAAQPLIEAICVPENVNHRGTLVYALSAFDCLEHLALLVDLVLNGNYEVSSGAYQIIESQLNDDHRLLLKTHLDTVDPSRLLREHNRDGYEALTELISCS